MSADGPVPPVAPPAGIEVEVAGDLRAARHVRGVLRRWCEQLDLPAETCDVALLLGSELVTNAVLHGRGPVRFSAGLDGDHVHLAVSDTSPAAPLARPAGPEDPHGRGMHLLAALSSAWGVRAHAPGKAVWCRIPRVP